MRLLKIQRGDTIVEVLISVAIIGLVLAGAYVSANKSLNGTRNSQEHAEAARHVEDQLERLKAAAADSTSGVFAANNFCLGGSPVVKTITNPADFASYHDDCTYQQTGGGITYYLLVTRNPSGGSTTADQETFAAQAQWPKIGGVGLNKVKIVYRVRQ